MEEIRESEFESNEEGRAFRGHHGPPPLLPMGLSTFHKQSVSPGGTFCVFVGFASVQQDSPVGRGVAGPLQSGSKLRGRGGSQDATVPSPLLPPLFLASLCPGF